MSDRPVTLPKCPQCGTYYTPRPQHSAYGHLDICRQCNGEQPHGERGMVKKMRRAKREKAAEVAPVVQINGRKRK